MVKAASTSGAQRIPLLTNCPTLVCVAPRRAGIWHEEEAMRSTRAKIKIR